MAASSETVDAPFTAFAFEIVLTLVTPVASIGDPVCQGAFSECDGLALDMDPRTVVEGGANDSQTHLVTTIRPGQLTMRRGMTTTSDLWAWMAAAAVTGHDVRADGQLTMLDGKRDVQARFTLTGCLPVRVRGPALNAQTGLVAVEELGLAVGRLTLEGGDDPPAAAASIGGRISGGLGLSGQLGGTLSATGRVGLGVGS